VAINLLNAGMAVSQVAKLTDLSIEEVQQLQVDSENDA
jgi:predicted transposase YdaD